MTRTKYFTRELRERFAKRDRMSKGGLTTLFAMLFILAVALLAGSCDKIIPRRPTTYEMYDTLNAKCDSILKELRSHH